MPGAYLGGDQLRGVLAHNVKTRRAQNRIRYAAARHLPDAGCQLLVGSHSRDGGHLLRGHVLDGPDFRHTVVGACGKEG